MEQIMQLQSQLEATVLEQQEVEAKQAEIECMIERKDIIIEEKDKIIQKLSEHFLTSQEIETENAELKQKCLLLETNLKAMAKEPDFYKNEVELFRTQKLALEKVNEGLLMKIQALELQINCHNQRIEEIETKSQIKRQAEVMEKLKRMVKNNECCVYLERCVDEQKNKMQKKLLKILAKPTPAKQAALEFLAIYPELKPCSKKENALLNEVQKLVRRSDYDLFERRIMSYGNEKDEQIQREFREFAEKPGQSKHLATSFLGPYFQFRKKSWFPFIFGD